MKKTFFVMSFLLMSSLALAATIPKYVTVQGRLTDSNNVPVPSGSYLFNFTIWNDPTAGTLIWTDQFNAPVSNGVFNIELGRNAQLNIPFDQPYFLEIRVGGNLLSPRVNFTSAPYAFTSTSGGGGGGNGWTASGSTVYNNTAGTKVGIGTSNPSHELNVVGGLNVTSPAFFGGSVSLTSNNLQMNGNSITNVSWINASTYYDTGNSAYYLDPSGTSSLNKVGIGTASPSDKLEVAGNINVSSSGVYERGAAVGSSIGPCGANQYVGGATVSGGIVTGGSCQNDQTGGGGGNGWAVSGSTVYNNTAGTNVGIGTSTPTTKLDIEGGDLSGTALVGQTFSNLKGNAGFESGDNSSWTVELNGTFGVSNTYAHTGTYSFRDFSGIKFCNEYLFEDIDTKPNTNYSVSGWIKTIAETATSEVFISEGIGTGCSEWARMVNVGITGTNDWTQKFIEAWNSSTCTKIRVGFTKQYCTSSGDTYFDDLMVTEGYSPKKYYAKPIVDSYSGNQSIMGGNVGIGTSGSSAKLSVVNTSATEISGTAMSPTFRTSAGALGTTAGNELSLASIGFTGTNNIALGIRGFRTYGGTDWTTTAIGLGMDVDNTVRAVNPSGGGNTNGASLWLTANGSVGIGTPWPTATLHVSGTNTLTANFSTGSNILSTYSISPSIDSNASYVADWFSLNTGNNQNLNGNLYGVAGQIYHWYNGIVDTVKGVDVWIQNNATGTIRHAWGFHVGGGNAAGGTIQDFRGVYIGAPGKASGTITNNYGIYLDNQTVGSASYAIYDAGGTNYFGDKVGIGTSSPTYQLQLSTDSAAKPGTNTWTISSDSRIKTNVSNFTDGLNVIMKMRPITYNYNGLGGFVDDGTMKVGIIAQELQSVAPYMITSHKAKLSSNDTNETNILDYQGSALAFVTVNAIKEQQQQIEEQNQQIEQLKAENLQLQQRLEKIENKLNLE